MGKPHWRVVTVAPDPRSVVREYKTKREYDTAYDRWQKQQLYRAGGASAQRMRDAARVSNKHRRDHARAFIENYFRDHPCVDCGINDPDVMEFDHVHGKKVIDVSAAVNQGFAWDLVLEEISKCEARCGNCHRKVTKQRYWEKRRAKEGR